MRFAVVGHVEWIHFAEVPHVPKPGDIVHATRSWEEAAGGGAVAAVQLVKLAGHALFFTALAGDELGRRSASQLTGQGVEVHAAHRDGTQRRGFTHLTTGERTITVIGERIVCQTGDPLPWEELHSVDGVYLTGGDAGVVRAARAAKVLVGTPRASDALAGSMVELDALVYSANDADERAWAEQVRPTPRYLVATEGAAGGHWTGEEGTTGAWRAAELPGPVGDAYGAGDCFAAGLTFALGRGDGIDAALELASRCGATEMTGHGPYERQLTLTTAAD